jgi:hypothetical protein
LVFQAPIAPGDSFAIPMPITSSPGVKSGPRNF